MCGEIAPGSNEEPPHFITEIVINIKNILVPPFK